MNEHMMAFQLHDKLNEVSKYKLRPLSIVTSEQHFENMMIFS